MIRAWLDLPLNLIFLTLALPYGLGAAFVYWILFRSPARRRACRRSPARSGPLSARSVFCSGCAPDFSAPE